MTDDIARELAKPLDPEHIQPPAPGKYGDYVDAHHVLSEANRIFGWDGWSYDVKRCEECSKVMGQDRKGGPQVRVGYIAHVTATVKGVYRTGIGAGSGYAKPENEADAHDSAAKEAETDALKRALRSFGNTFGLALYDKQRKDVGVPEPTPEERREAWVLGAIEAIQNAANESAVGVMIHRQQENLLKLKEGDPERFNRVKSAAANRGVNINFDKKEVA
jgi:DNA recombination protein Rad52